MQIKHLGDIPRISPFSFAGSGFEFESWGVVIKKANRSGEP